MDNKNIDKVSDKNHIEKPKHINDSLLNNDTSFRVNVKCKFKMNSKRKLQYSKAPEIPPKSSKLISLQLMKLLLLVNPLRLLKYFLTPPKLITDFIATNKVTVTSDISVHER